MIEQIGFSKIASYDYFDQRKNKLKKEIHSQTKEYLLGVDEEEFKQYLIEKNKLEPLEIDFSKEFYNKPLTKKITLSDRFRNQEYEVDGYIFEIKYPFTGSSEIFEIRPSQYSNTGEKITVSNSSNTVQFDLVIHKLNPDDFKKEKEQKKSSAFANLNYANIDAKRWNNELPIHVTKYLKEAKAKYETENEFFAAINLKVDSNTNNVFAAPTIQKKVVVQPTLAKTTEFASNPIMAKEMYKDVIEAIYSSGKTMESKPSLYKGKNEEGIRDQFLFVLESRYISATSMGEAFNKGGKTDILLKYAGDGSNLFIAECKIWKGPSEFHKAISQLFDNYLTWRDSKVAVMFFVKNTDFSEVLKTIKAEAKKHLNFVKENGSNGESSFSYIFNLPQDKDKEVFLEIMAFHYID